MDCESANGDRRGTETELLVSQSDDAMNYGNHFATNIMRSKKVSKVSNLKSETSTKIESSRPKKGSSSFEIFFIRILNLFEIWFFDFLSSDISNARP